MNDTRLERLLDDVLVSTAPSRAPARLRLDIASETSAARQRPRWLALIKEPPMRISQRVAVGSPTFRLVSITAIALALVLAAAGAVAVGASLVAPKLPEPFGLARNGTLVYSDGGDIWIADETGANGIAVITGPETDRGPWYSHDGTRFAFVRDAPDGSSTLMVARADGTGATEVMPDFTYADWSPDDTRFVVSHMVDGELVVSIVPADGTGVPRTLDLGGLRLPEWGPVWRPQEGAEIILVAQRPGMADMGLYGIRPDGTGLRTIGPVSTVANAWQLSFQNPNLSPDGASIGYTNWEANDAGVTDAWGHLRDLTTGLDTEAFAFPHFSPDGSTIMGESDDGLVIGSLDGSQPPTTIEPAWVGNNNRSWDISPNGTKAYITVGEPKTTWIIDLESGTSTETSQPIRDFPYWQRLAP